jgi:hypothetical protein
MAKWTIPDTPSPEAIVRAALVAVIAKCNNQLDDEQVYWPMQFVNLVRALASDPAEVAAILEEAKKERG